jgi:hypothetical protein
MKTFNVETPGFTRLNGRLSLYRFLSKIGNGAFGVEVPGFTGLKGWLSVHLWYLPLTYEPEEFLQAVK